MIRERFKILWRVGYLLIDMRYADTNIFKKYATGFDKIYEVINSSEIRGLSYPEAMAFIMSKLHPYCSNVGFVETSERYQIDLIK